MGATACYSCHIPRNFGECSFDCSSKLLNFKSTAIPPRPMLQKFESTRAQGTNGSQRLVVFFIATRCSCSSSLVPATSRSQAMWMFPFGHALGSVSKLEPRHAKNMARVQQVKLNKGPFTSPHKKSKPAETYQHLMFLERAHCWSLFWNPNLQRPINILCFWKGPIAGPFFEIQTCRDLSKSYVSGKGPLQVPGSGTEVASYMWKGSLQIIERKTWRGKSFNNFHIPDCRHSSLYRSKTQEVVTSARHSKNNSKSSRGNIAFYILYMGYMPSTTTCQ